MSDYSQHPSILAFHLFSYVVRNHMIINKRIQNSVLNLFSSYSGGCSVGFHLRLSGTLSDFKERSIYENFLFESDINTLQECKYIDYQKRPVFYVASDSSLVKERIRANSNATVITHNATSLHTGHAIGGDKEQTAFQSVLFDIVALSKCHILIVTKGSSLSYLAAAYQGNVPYYISRNTTCYYPTSLTTLAPSSWS